MDVGELLVDAFGRVRDATHGAIDGASRSVLTYRPDPDANSIAWLVWHLTRIQDDHVAEVGGLEQVWTAQGDADRFGLPFDDDDTGYGHNNEDLGAVRASAADLAAYLRATHEQTLGFLAGLDSDALDRVVDERWDPPVTL